MRMNPSGVTSTGLVVLVSLVVAGILTEDYPSVFYLMSAVTIVLAVTAIIFLRQQQKVMTDGE